MSEEEALKEFIENSSIDFNTYTTPSKQVRNPEPTEEEKELFLRNLGNPLWT